MLAEYSRLDATDFARSYTRALKTVVVGAGAVGNEVIKNLCLLGIGQITAIDPDVVEPSNLTRSIFFRSLESAHEYKVDAIDGCIRRLFPDTDFVPIRSEVADVGFQRLSGADLIFSCLDNELARLEIAYIAKRLSLPVIDAGLADAARSRCRITFFPGHAEAPCFGCIVPVRRREELLTRWSAVRYSCWMPGEASDGTPLSSTPMMASAAAALQVEFGLRAIRGREREAFSLILSLYPNHGLERLLLNPAVECPFHEVLALPRVPRGDRIESLLDGAGSDMALILDWPICCSAECSDCGKCWEPRQRVARFRAVGRCPACGSGNLLENEVLTSITADSPWRKYRFTDLGLPGQHLYTFRRLDRS